MKIIKAEYDSLEDGLMTKVKATLEFNDGTQSEGFILIENDGRDMEFEGFSRPYDQFIEEWQELSEEEWDKLNEPCELGLKEYEALNA